MSVHVEILSMYLDIHYRLSTHSTQILLIASRHTSPGNMLVKNTNK